MTPNGPPRSTFSRGLKNVLQSVNRRNKKRPTANKIWHHLSISDVILPNFAISGAGQNFMIRDLERGHTVCCIIQNLQQKNTETNTRMSSDYWWWALWLASFLVFNLWPTWMGSILRLRQSHTLTFPSMDPDKMTVDSSLKDTQFTQPETFWNESEAPLWVRFHCRNAEQLSEIFAVWVFAISWKNSYLHDLCTCEEHFPKRHPKIWQSCPFPLNTCSRCRTKPCNPKLRNRVLCTTSTTRRLLDSTTLWFYHFHMSCNTVHQLKQGQNLVLFLSCKLTLNPFGTMSPARTNHEYCCVICRIQLLCCQRIDRLINVSVQLFCWHLESPLPQVGWTVLLRMKCCS